MKNLIILLGRIGQDPEINRLENGTPVGRFSLATTEKWKDQSGEAKEDTQWHSVVVWRNLAEITEKYVKKGDLLYVEGKVTYRKYTDKNGVEKTSTEVVASEIKLLPNGKGKDDDKGNAEPVKSEPTYLDSFTSTPLPEVPTKGEKYGNGREMIEVRYVDVSSNLVEFTKGQDLTIIKTSIEVFVSTLKAKSYALQVANNDDLPF
jgi:single-strand DNA-binding protein